MPREATFGYYMVGVFDVLGQSNKLQEQSKLPLVQPDGDPEKVKQIVDNLRSTAGVVLQYRRFFREAFDSADAHTGRIDLLPPEQRSEMQAAMATDVLCWGASDSIYTAVSLAAARHPAATAADVYRVLHAAASTWLGALAADHPIRGGIDVGLGMDIEPGEIYGQAIESAHYLESEVAAWPRVVVGKQCRRYLDTVKEYGGVDERWSRAAVLADLCLSMLRRDDDGATSVDALGDTMLEQAKDLPGVRELVMQAHDRVRATGRRYRDDKKLGPRYRALLGYFDECGQRWRGRGR